MKISIKYNPYLDNIMRVYCRTLSSFGGYVFDAPKDVEKKAKIYATEWAKVGDKITNAIEDITKCKSPYSRVDVGVVAVCHRIYSNPIMIPSYFTVDRMINNVTHELIHKSGLKTSVKIYNNYINETKLTCDHILVHAILKKIYLDVLDRKELLDLNVETSAKHSTTEYSRAWEIVEKEGYKNIIEEYLAK